MSVITKKDRENCALGASMLREAVTLLGVCGDSPIDALRHASRGPRGHAYALAIEALEDEIETGDIDGWSIGTDHSSIQEAMQNAAKSLEGRYA